MSALPNFDAPFKLSDAVLIATDSEGNERKLHANKGYLATYSSFFERMFFSEPQEETSSVLKVDCSYEALKLILEIIYGQSRDFYNVNQVYKTSLLVELYKAADFFDISAIRKMCMYQMLSRPSVDMAIAALGIASIDVGFHDTLMEILEKVGPDDVMQFLYSDDSLVLFSKNDIKLIYQMIAQKTLPKPSQTFRTWYSNRTLPDLSENYENALIDSTQKWPRSDVLFKTKNSDKKLLYSNKTVLSMVSTHFAGLFFSIVKTEEPMECTEVEVDVDYMVMKNILTILHHCYNNGNLTMFVRSNTYLLYNMYCAADKDALNIPVIRDICVKGLAGRVTRRHLEVAIRLNLDERSHLVNRMEVKELFQWLSDWSNEDPSEFFTVYDELQYEVHNSTMTKPVLSLCDVRVVIEKLLHEFNNINNNGKYEDDSKYFK